MRETVVPVLLAPILAACAVEAASDESRDPGISDAGEPDAAPGFRRTSRPSRSSGGGPARCGVPPMSPRALDATDCSVSATVISDEYAPDEILTIQVVFHVIRSSTGEGNVSDQRLLAQIEVLNEDFGAEAGTLGEPGTDARVRFVLAERDPDGDATTGIKRYMNDDWFVHDDSFPAQIGWDQDRYLNIYTAELDNMLGYAYYPQTSAGQTWDGVYLDHEFVGRNVPGAEPYELGRTATHEVGHYLGLKHTFDGACGAAGAPYTSGDLIADTVAEKTEHYVCVESESECPGGGLDPIHNYMNYTDDACMNQFTPEQANRMRCAVLNYRPELPGAVGLPPPLEASFVHEAELLDVAFEDTSDVPSSAGAVSRSWSFGDGVSSTAGDPLHTYAAEGVYTVSLTVSIAGSSATATREIAVNQAPAAAFEHEVSGLTVSFADGSSDPGGVSSWSWAFGDGATSTEADPSHTYAEDGTYTVTLTVTDADGAVDTEEVAIILGESRDGSDDGGCSTRGGVPGLLGWLAIALALAPLRARRVTS
jgi:PKD repeat protein